MSRTMSRMLFAGSIIATASMVAAPAALAGPPEMAVELGMRIPFVRFDSSAAITDNKGEADEIESGMGWGALLGYVFRGGHGIQVNYFRVISDSEDRHGDNYFSIRTRHTSLTYRKTWNVSQLFGLFVSTGAGSFAARAMEVDHPNERGWSWHLGGGLEFTPEHVTSFRLEMGRMRVYLDSGDADNYFIALAAVWYIGGHPAAAGG